MAPTGLSYLVDLYFLSLVSYFVDSRVEPRTPRILCTGMCGRVLRLALRLVVRQLRGARGGLLWDAPFPCAGMRWHVLRGHAVRRWCRRQEDPAFSEVCVHTLPLADRQLSGARRGSSVLLGTCASSSWPAARTCRHRSLPAHLAGRLGRDDCVQWFRPHRRDRSGRCALRV